MKKSKTSKRFLFVSLILCVALAASAVAAQAQVEPQQGAINTTRSNRKNTSRTAGHIDTLSLLIRRDSGERIALRTLTDSDGDGTLSDSEGAFDFGALPAGAYVLTLSLQGRVSGLGSSLQDARIILTGGVHGKVEKDWNFETNKASDVAAAEAQKIGGLGSQINGVNDKAASTNKLGLRIDTLESKINSRTDTSSQTGIAFEADGKTKITGKIILPKG